MTLAFAGDVVVAILLIVTIVHAATLNRRLGGLRNDKAQLQMLVESLAGATASAGAGVAALKAATEDVGHELQARLEKAQALRDDLSYLVERGDAAADRLEGSIRAQREGARPADPPKPEPRLGREAAAEKGPIPLGAAVPSRAERDLMRALAGRR